MDAFLNLLAQYGPWVYGLLFLYCSLKSGALPLFAGYAAYAGALDPLLVTIATFAGGYLGDELRFWVARNYGSNFLSRWPKAEAALRKAQMLMERYGILYIFLYRYPKGMRTIGALPVGLGEMTWKKFTLLNASSAALWTGILVGCGYLLGETVAAALVDNWGIFSVSLLAGFILLGCLAWWRLKQIAQPAEKTENVPPRSIP